MTQRTCGNCRWWNRYSGEAAGDCQRHPPVYNGEWARTDEVDFCGEWADKAITPEQEQRRERVLRVACAIMANEHAAGLTSEQVWARAAGMVDAEQEQRRETVRQFAVALLTGCGNALAPHDAWGLAAEMADAEPKIGGKS